MPITPEQRNARRYSLGSSDSPPVVGVDPWRNRHDVYVEKTQELDEIVDNDAIEIGNDFEVPLLHWAARQLGVEIRVNVPTRHPEDLIFTASLDAQAVDPALRMGIEAKTTSLPEEYGDEGTDQVPEGVIVQATHQMYVAELDVVWVPVLLARFDRLQRCLYKVERNEDLVSHVAQEGREFWHSHVLPKNPPVGVVSSLDVVKRIRRVAGETAKIESDLADLYEEKKAARKTAVDEEDEAKSALLASLGDCEAGDFGDENQIYTYLEQSRTTVDGKLLRMTHPEIYRQHTKTSTFRVLRRVNRRRR